MNYNINRLKGVLNTIELLFNSIDKNDMVNQLGFIQDVENAGYKNYIKNKGEIKNLIDIPF